MECRLRPITMAWLVTTLLLVAGLSDRHIIVLVEANQRIETITLLYTYVVHVPSKSMPAIFRVHGHDVQGWYRSLVALISDKNTWSNDDDRFVYVYRHVFEGFAVRLNPREAHRLGQLREVAMVLQDRASIKLHATHLDLSASPTPIETAYDDGPSLGIASGRGADNTIVGVLDTGIWPEHPSFSNDAGFGPIPTRWRGKCESYLPTFNGSAACNRKLIGTRAFFRGYEAGISRAMDKTSEFRSPRDSHGHGTKTASTAVGSPVRGSSFLGFAPLHRLAVYKVCWLPGCYDSDILAGFEAAISDGVDIISVSIPDDPSPPSFGDPVRLGALVASTLGILTAGNQEPDPATLALLKSAHSDWSPAMIGSALATTMTKTMVNLGQVVSYSRDEPNRTAPSFTFGVFDPIAALDPSLVYDISPQTYVDFICGLNSMGPPYFDPYTTFFCDTSSPPGPTTLGSTPRPIDLNTPSLFVTFNETSDTRPFTLTTSRTLTNVGPLDSAPTYTLVSLIPPAFLDISVTPSILTFNTLHRNLIYFVTFTFSSSDTNFSSFGSLTWSDGVHNVSTLILFTITS